ncbi:hypothetical protein ACWGRK_08690 [Saccharomonospora azurea]|uniref:hypothetical protein n=1 Tax=Saccharomonospora azurea TaxID=40988 RepID=UPI003D8A9FB5
MIQFLSGFIVLLDLYGPDRLMRFGAERERGARARRRAVSFLPLHRGSGRYKALESAFEEDLRRGDVPRAGGVRGDGSLREVRLSQDYRASIARFRGHFGGVIECLECYFFDSDFNERVPYLVWECQHGEELFRRHVETLFARHLTREERLAERLFHRRRKESKGLVAGCLVLVMLAYIGVVDSLPGLDLSDEIHGVVVALIAMSIAYSFTVHAHSMAEAVWLGSVSIVLRLSSFVSIRIANLMNRSQSAHPLRWAAFVMFVVGFMFDLLAS